MTCLINIELEKKKELEKRKKNRLIQVREQSKDFASKLRESIQAETVHQRNKYFESERKKLHKEQLEELNRLKELYQTCIEKIGESHREATKQINPNIVKQLESARITAESAHRGVKARKQQRLNEATRCQKYEAPIKQKKATRNKENLRSFFISSLPKSSGVPENHSLYPKISRNQSCELNNVAKTFQDIPSNLVTEHHIESDLQVINDTAAKKTYFEKCISGGCKGQKEQNFDADYEYTKTSLEPQSPNHLTCDFDCRCRYGQIQLKRRSHSEPRVISEYDSELESIEQKKIKTRSRSCSPQSVRTLNYSDCRNLYESNQRQLIKITQHSSPTQSKEERLVETTVKEQSPVKTADNEELKRKSDERCTKALQREKLKRDFQQLLQDLENLRNEKSVIKSIIKSKAGVHQRKRDILLKSETKQIKLSEAFEKLLHSRKPIQSQYQGSWHKTQQFETDESSPSILNLALYEKTNMSSKSSSPQQPSLVRRIISTEEITVSQTSIPESDDSNQSTHVSPGRSPPRLKQTSPSTPTSKHSTYNNSPPRSSKRSNSKGRKFPDDVSQCTSGQVHVTVNVLEPPQHKKKCKRRQPSTDSSTSYFSPPEILSPSQKLLLDAIMIQVNKQTLNEDLKKYIKKLLSMSRESIDDLDVSSSSGYIDPTRSPPKKAIQDDIVKLSELTEAYADKVNTLVDMFEQFDTPEQFYTPPQIFDRGPSTSRGRTHPQFKTKEQYFTPPEHLPGTPNVVPPSRIPTLQRQPSPVQVPTPITSRKSPYPTKYKPPGRICPSNQRIPRKPTTPPMQRKTKRRQSPISQVKKVGPPPGSTESKIPQIVSSPYPPNKAVPKPPGIQSPFGLSSNLLPHPIETFEQPAARSPLPDIKLTTAQSSLEAPGLSLTIHADSSDIEKWAFQGLPTPPPHEPGQTRDPMSLLKEVNPDISIIKTPGSSFDLSEELAKHGMADKFKHLKKKASPKTVAFQDDFGTQGFGNEFGAQDDFGDNEFGDEDFQGGADIILQSEAPPDDYVEYPEDFPPPTDVFGPGFDWENANQTKPEWPHSFPGEPLGGSEMSDQDQIIIDTSFDTDAVTHPLNVERINEIRRKLSKICNDQYREVIEMLKDDYASDQDRFGNLLKRVTSDPFEDPNATLAPVGRSQARPQSPGRNQVHPEDQIDNITSLSILSRIQENKD